MNFINLIAAFLEGLALIVSPCILPVLPIVLASGVDSGRFRPYGLIVGFMFSFSVFTLLASQLVKSLGLEPEVIRNASFIILGVFGVIMLSEKLSDKFGEATQGLANLGQKVNSAQNKTPGKEGFWSGFLMGCAVGLIWAPCAGPIMAVVFIQVLQQETDLGSVLTVLAFSMGAGIPMLILTVLGNYMMRQLNFLKQNSRIIRKVLGVLLVGGVLLAAFGGNWWDSLSEAATGSQKVVANNKLLNPLPRPYKAPEITGITAWPNSKPQKLADLKGKVVLIDFWTYSCINCVRTLPYITNWYDKYRDKGLVVIGVHAPEFAFEKNVGNVKEAIAKHSIHYPVALDNNFATWKAFENQYWPAHYLIDKQGNVVYTHHGEGRYAVTEQNIRTLLGLGDIKATETRKETKPYNPNQSPETYLGYERAANFNSPERQQPDVIGKYTFPASLAKNHWALKGSWLVGGEKIISQSPGAALRYQYAGKSVYLVLGTPPGKTINVKVLNNGKLVKTIPVKSQTLYTLLDWPGFQQGTLELQADAPGLSAYAFTFGG